MRIITRWMLASLLALVPLAGLVQTAAANTELVPAARLVAPYWDIRGTKETFLLLTNVSNHDLSRTVNEHGVHLEFFDKTCARANETIDLSPGDIDQLQLSVKPNMKDVIGAGPTYANFGWVDIDVRDNTATLSDEGLELNSLLGTVIVVDGANDFAIAYPMASSIGSSDRGYHNTIVTRNAAGAAATWSGRYEPYPGRVFVPMFLADGTEAGQTFSSTLYVAGVADGNWLNGSSTGPGEAPGQAVGSETTCASELSPCNVTVGVVLWDGCENNASAPKKAHYLSGTLTGLFGDARMNRSHWTDGCTFPGLDEYSGGPVGWIDLPNTATDKQLLSTAPDVFAPRGLVGLLVGSAISAGNQIGDTTRMWGDPEYGGRDGNYSLVDNVNMCLNDNKCD